MNTKNVIGIILTVLLITACGGSDSDSDSMSDSTFREEATALNFIKKHDCDTREWLHKGKKIVPCYWVVDAASWEDNTNPYLQDKKDSMMSDLKIMEIKAEFTQSQLPPVGIYNMYLNYDGLQFSDSQIRVFIDDVILDGHFGPMIYMEILDSELFFGEPGND